MRWEQLFDDMESQLAAQDRRELDLEVADRTRRERALVGLSERLLGGDSPLRIRVLGGHQVDGTVVDLGDGWVLLRETPRMAALVRLGSVVAVRGLGALAATGQRVARAKRFDLGFALRALSRDRATVTLGLSDGSALTGTIDGVGADCLDLSEHPADLPRRPENVTSATVVAYAALSVVRSRS